MNINDLTKDESSLLKLAFERAVNKSKNYLADKCNHVYELQQLDAAKYQQRHNESLDDEIAFWQKHIKNEQVRLEDFKNLYKKMTEEDYCEIPF